MGLGTSGEKLTNLLISFTVECDLLTLSHAFINMDLKNLGFFIHFGSIAFLASVPIIDTFPCKTLTNIANICKHFS